MVDQSLGERGGQHQLALGNGDEAVPQAVELELGPAGLADAGVEMMRVLDMAGRAGRRREYPRANTFGQVCGGGPAAFENGRDLPGDGKLQRHSGLSFLDAESEGVHVDALPAERQHFVPAHPGVEAEPEGVADRWVIDFGLDSGAPARQHLGGRRNLSARLAVELAAAGTVIGEFDNGLAERRSSYTCGQPPAAKNAEGPTTSSPICRACINRRWPRPNSLRCSRARA